MDTNQENTEKSSGGNTDDAKDKIVRSFPKKETSKKQKRSRMKPAKLIKIAVLVLVVIGLWLVLVNNSSKNASLDGIELKNITTYLSSSSSDPDKVVQSEFQVGDSIQVGFSYDTEENEGLVRYIVKSGEEEVFKTNLFKLNPLENEQFVSINNTSLPSGDYTVELVGNDGDVIATVDYSIKDSK